MQIRKNKTNIANECIGMKEMQNTVTNIRIISYSSTLNIQYHVCYV